MREIRSLRLVALLFPPLVWGQSAEVNSSRFHHDLFNPLATSTAPASQCNTNSLNTAFQCDTTNWAAGLGLQTSGTAGQRPASGYAFDYNLSNIGVYRYASDGWNQDTNDNGGRTGLLSIWSKIDNYSTNGGDAISFTCFPSVFATKASATQFLASSEGACLAGQLNAYVNGAFLEGIGDLNIKDQGNDIAAAAVVVNFFRTVGTGNLNTNWMGYILQNKGAVPVDAMERLVGPAKQTFDATDQTYPDQNITSIAIASGGTNYVVGDIITAVGGTCDQAVTLKVLAVTGGVINGVVGTGFGIERNGMCATPPSNAVAFTNAHGGSQATFTITWTGTSNALIAGAPNACWYGNSTSDPSVYNTHYPSTVLLGTSFICYSPSIPAWNFVSGNTSSLQVGTTQTAILTKLKPTGGIASPLFTVAGTQFTVASGTGACSATTAIHGGVQAGDFQCTGSTGASTVTLTLAASSQAYTCWGRDVTTPTTVTQIGAVSTTSVTLTLTSVTANDAIQFGCLGY